MNKALYGALLLACLPVNASDGAMTAGNLQEICTAADAVSKAACRFYILGITEGMNSGMDIADGKTRGGRPCVPENSPAPSLELAVKLKMGQLLMVYPEDRKLNAAGVVSAMLISSFPCRKK